MSRSAFASLVLVLAACNGSGGKGGEPVTGTSGGTPGGTPGGSPTPPIAENDLASVDEGGVVDVDVVNNDLVTSHPLALGSVTVVDPPGHGSLTVGADGVVVYTHDGSETEDDSFTYSIEDDVGQASNVATVAIAVNPVNDLPVAVDDVAALDQGENLQVNVAGNDSDPDDGLDLGSIAIVTPPAYGSASPNTNGTVDYVHDGTGVPYDSFTYTISDDAGAVSNVATVDLTVYTSNLPPIAGDDFVVALEGQTTLVDLATNDFDADDGLDLGSVTVVGAPLHGTVVQNGDGTVDYVHDGSEGASDSFSYQIDDQSGAPSNVAVVVVAVVNTNDPPTANGDDAVVGERQTVNVPVLSNDVDVDSALNPLSVTVGTAPAYGSLTVNANGTIDYTHDGSQVAGDSFTYRVSDVSGAASGYATVDVQINLSNDPPELVDGAETVTEGDVVVLDLLPYAYDSDDGLDIDSIVVTADPGYGSISVNLDGTVTYAHDGSELALDSFEFTIADVGGNVSNVATVDLQILPVNDPPVAVADTFGAAEGAATVLPVLGNDDDADDGLDVTTVDVVSGPSSGTAAPNGDGTVTYTHDGSESVVDSFSYRVFDLSGAPSNVVTVSVGIQGANDAPVAVGDAAATNEGGGVTVAVLGNDSDPDDGLDPASVTVLTPPARGSVAVNVTGTIDYQHDGSETASDSFTYRVYDLAGAGSNVATVNVTVAPVNDAPVAAGDGASVLEGSAGNVISVLANDTDADDGIDAATVEIVAPPARGTAVANVNGTVTYGHNGSENPGDSFTYRVRDNAGAASNTVTVSIVVGAVNDGPTATNDPAVMVGEGGLVNVVVLSNDVDVDDGLDPSSVAIVAAPARGTAVVQPNGSITYTHDGSETGSDSFSYRVNDYAGATSNTALVSVTVSAVNDAPVANDDAAGPVANGDVLNVNLAANDSDAEGALNLNSIVLVSAPANGSVFVLGNGTVDYTHNGSATLSDSFTYRISDSGGAQSNVATVTLSIEAAASCVGSTSLYFSGATQTFVAPCTGDYTISAYGAQGNGGNGGLGGLATGTVTLLAGEVLYVNAGGMNGFNGGGADWFVGDRNGGGATDVRRGTNALANRILVAGGGGGGGFNDVSGVTGGAGGGGTCGPNYCGGGGASGYGGSGGNGDLAGGFGNVSCHSGGAGGGGATSGGAGSCTTCYGGTCGQAGSAGQGGNGDTWENGICYTTFGGTSGGGGGYYGGGGSSVGNCGGGGGGGGSSWTGSMSGASFAGGVQAGDGYVDITWDETQGAHASVPFNPPSSQPWFCGGSTEIAYYQYFGETTFDACETIANLTGTQFFVGPSTPYLTGWIGDQDGTSTAVVTDGYNWPNELVVPRDSLYSCVLTVLDDRATPTANPPEQVYVSPVTGRTWHFWDIQDQTHDQTLAFAEARGARIINPNVVGLTGLARSTPPTHWCFASAEFNGGGYCNTGSICDFMVGYWE